MVFPKTYQTIEFSKRPGANAQPLSTRTSEGLSLGLHVAFQYQLQKDNLDKLYQLTLLDYEKTLIRQARDVLQ